MSVRFVAEVSSNHHQNLDRCLLFIDKSAEIGCSAVKFQLFKIDELFAPEILKAREELRKRKDWELPVSFLPMLKKRCNEKKIQFSCTPFYLKAVEELFPYVDFYKIASYEMLWNDLLIACAKTQKPIVLSTGMATLDEITNAVRVLTNAGCSDLTLLHCVSGYPTPIEECNLAAIETLHSAFHLSPFTFHLKFGWSDHSAEPGVIYRAIHKWSVSLIEFHLDLDGTGDEYKTGHCWLPEQIGNVIKTVNIGLQTDGAGIKEPAPSELKDRDWRADPSDGLRPMKKTRLSFKK